MRDNDLYNVFSEIEPDNALKSRIEDRIEGKKMKKSTIKKTGRTAVLAAALVAALSVSAFAMTPAGQEKISSILAYFQNDNAVEMTSLEELAKYNEEIGASFSKDGCTLTLDNVAADDNYVHVFYTITSDSKPFYEGDDPKAAMYSDDVNNMRMDIHCMINGKPAGMGANHNTYDGYFADSHTYKAAEKYNIALQNIPDNFKVELFASLMDEGYKASPVFEKLYSGKGKEITAEEKADLWYVSADVDKSKVKVESVTREINVKLPWSGVTVEKAVFSPFGSQLVVSTEAGSGEDSALRSDMMAVFDENGKAVDMLNTDLSSGADGSSRNAIEILKADKNIKQLKFVPLKFNEHGDCPQMNYQVGQYPINCKVNDYGSVVVTDIRISDGKIEIDYYKDGYVMYDPGFLLLDDNGNNAEPGGKLGCVRYTDVHYDTNSYTARYEYDKFDDNGKPVPADESVSAESLKKSFTTLGIFDQSYVELDFGSAVTVDLK